MNNPFDQVVLDLQDRIAALRTRINEATTSRDYHYSREQAFARNGDYGIGYQQASAAYNAALRLLQYELNPQMEALLSELEAAKANRDRVAAAAAQAVAAGLDPASAMQQALAETERAEGTRKLLTYVGIGLLVLLVVFAIVYWRRSRKK